VTEQPNSSALKFRKRPVEVEALRIQRPWKNITAFCPEAYLVKEATGALAFVQIKTLEGVMRAEIGDWIVKGVQGEFYPVKPDIFEQTYEAVDD
jgi:hypothetical protein